MFKRLIGLFTAALFAFQPIAAEAQLVQGRTPTGRNQPILVDETGKLQTLPAGGTTGVTGNVGITGNVGTTRVDATSVTFSPAASAATLFTVDTTGYGSVAFQLTGTWIGTVVPEYSDDNVTWNGALAQVGTSGAFAASFTANNVYVVPAYHRYVRARVSAYTSGTIAGSAYLRYSSVDPSPTALSITGTLTTQGAGANNAALTGNPVLNGCVASSTVPTASTSGNLGRMWCSLNGAINVSPNADAASIGATVRSSTSAEATAGNFIVKASAGNVYSVNVLGGATAGYFMIFNSITVPVDGAVVPVMCFSVPVGGNVSPNLATSVPAAFATGISVAFSSTGCFTKTSLAAGFIIVTYK